MIDNKHINKIILTLTASALILLLVFMYVFGGSMRAAAAEGYTMGYEKSLFSKESVIDINLQIDDSDWQELLDNAIAEEYYACDVTVNGTEYKNVGLRAKGNTSLSMVASSDSDRYSFKLSFDQYVDGQTCDGLAKLVLNNNYSDATMMKEAVCYDMFEFLGADASLYSYAKLSINGEYYGVYLALEPVEESFALRNYGSSYGELYKPDSMEMGGPGKMEGFKADDIKEMFEEMSENGDFDSSEMPQMPDGETGGNRGFDGEMSEPPQIPDSFGSNEAGGQPPEMPSSEADSENIQPPEMPNSNGGSQMPQPPDGFGGNEAGGGGFGGGIGAGSGADLNYTDDELDSYESIWEGSVFKTTDKDHRRVIRALKNICADDADSNTLEKYMDTDNLLRYMAVQTFVVNLDSLSGNMAHNYYLYEQDGQLNIIPWDYNLAFGGFQAQNASEVINFPIDTPFSSGVSTEDRQFFMALLENEEYLAQYHEYLRMLTEEYVGGGVFENTVNRIASLIDDLVQTDPTAFYSYDEYQAAVEMLKTTAYLRAESINAQLDGSIPSTRNGQQADSSTLVDASAVDLDVMGIMMGGGHDEQKPHRSDSRKF